MRPGLRSRVPAVVGAVLGVSWAAFAADGVFELERSQDQFGMRSHGIVERLGNGRRKFYPLPQSTAQEYLRLRLADVQVNAFDPQRYERQEVIGPWQAEAGKIWFGKAFYDGEGMAGVGAFGYFDEASRKYTLFSPPEAASYETSAILVEPDAVWVGLDRFGEDVSKYSGGLIRWDKSTHDVRRYALEFVVTRIERTGEALRLETHDGYAELRKGELRRFLKNGREIHRFPPPPTHY
jgi:hypothetical protein